MASRDIIPTTDAALVAWLLQMASKIDAHAAALAITAADVSALKADALMTEWTFKVQTALRSSGKQFTAYKATIVDGPLGGPVQVPPTAPTFLPPPTTGPDGARGSP